MTSWKRVLWLLMCLPPLALHAKTGDRTAQIKTDSTSTSANSGPNSKSVLTGNVRIVQGTMVAKGDLAEIYTGADSQVSRVVLTGARAHLQQLDDQGHLMEADARRIDYDLATGRAVLTIEASAKKEAMGVATANSSPPDVPASAYEHAQTLVALPDGRHLNLFCIGSGEPVVVLEAGGGEDSLTFQHAQGRIAAVTRVCSYDRAGFGFSDPSDVPNSAEHVVNDLHALVAAVGIPRPFVLVGHSNGGLYGRLYASKFPGDVAGMVFIDPNSVGLDMAAENVLDVGHRKRWRASDQADIAQARQCVALAAAGSLARNPASYPACLDDPPNADAALHRVLNEQMSRLPEQQSYLSETVDTYPQPDGGMSTAERFIQRVTFDFKDKPFIVMSGMTEQDSLPPRLRTRVNKAMLANQADLVSHSTRGRQVFVDTTTEDIQVTQPQVVTRYITEVVNEVKARAASMP